MIKNFLATTALIAVTAFSAQAQDVSEFILSLEGLGVDEQVAKLEQFCSEEVECAAAYAATLDSIADSGLVASELVAAVALAAESAIRGVSLSSNPVLAIQAATAIATTAINAVSLVSGVSADSIAQTIASVVSTSTQTIDVVAEGSPDAQQAANLAAGAISTSVIQAAADVGIDTTLNTNIAVAIQTAATVSNDPVQVAAINSVAAEITQSGITTETVSQIEAVTLLAVASDS